MDGKNAVYEHLKDISSQIDSSFTGLYREENPVVFYSTLSKGKEEVVKELLGLLVRKAIISTNEIIDGFSPEFLFVEGKKFAIYMQIVEDNVVVVSIVESKPNFSLLKFVHEKKATKLRELLPQIDTDIETQEEIQSSALENEEITEEELLKDLEVRNLNEIEQLEKVFSEQPDFEEITTDYSIQEEENTEKIEEETSNEIQNKEIEEEKTEETYEEMPSLEEILTEEFPSTEIKTEKDELISNIDDILNDIQKSFIKKIGPFGKLLFKKMVEKVEIKDNPTKNKIDELIDLLSNEIPVEERKKEFLKDMEKIIGGQ